MDAFAEIVRRIGLDRFGVHHVQNGQIHIGGAPRGSVRNLLCALDGGDNDGDVCFLRGLERAVAKLQELTALAARALRIDGKGALVVAHQLCGCVNGLERVARIFPVNGEKTTFVRTAAKDDFVQILRLGHKRERTVTQRPPGDEWVEVGAVIAHQQEFPLRRELFHPGGVNLHPADGQNPIVKQQRDGVVETIDLFVFLAHVHQQGENQHEQGKQQVCGDKAAECDREKPPQAERGGQEENPDCDQDRRDRKQIIQHGARPR